MIKTKSTLNDVDVKIGNYVSSLNKGKSKLMQVMRQLHVFLAVAAKRAIEDQGSEKEKWRKNACNQGL